MFSIDVNEIPQLALVRSILLDTITMFLFELTSNQRDREISLYSLWDDWVQTVSRTSSLDAMLSLY